MQELIEQVRQLERFSINDVVAQRLKEFESFKQRSEDEWFSELCFCILTANAKQKTAAAIQGQINAEGFRTLSTETLADLIKVNKHRFHNNKAKYIVGARAFANIKSRLSMMTEIQARDFIVEHINGLGMKEASHFLRNTGAQNLAILDRHIVSILVEYKIIKKPKKLDTNTYLELEKIMGNIASILHMTQAKLDLFLWYLRTGEVLK